MFGKRKTSSKAVIVNQPSLTTLPEDVLAIIVNHLAHESPQTLPSLALVSSLFLTLSRPALHRRLTFDLERSDQSAILRRCTFLEAQNLCMVVQDLTIEDRAYHYRHFDDNTRQSRHTSLDTICRVLPKMTGLRWLRYNDGVIPVEVLHAIQDRPNVRICATLSKLQVHPTYRHVLADSNLTTLLGCKQLRALSVNVTYNQGEQSAATMRPLKRLLLSCPNLRVLELHVRRARTGCAMYVSPVDHVYAGLGFVDGEKLPPLEELVLSDYPFGEPPIPNATHRWHIGYPGTGKEIDFWAENFDWSRLKKLHTPYAELISKISSKLIALEDFACETANKECLQTLPGTLTKLALLVVQIPETDELSTPPPPIRHGVDLVTLSVIQDSCPNITDLLIDLDHAGEWAYDIFDVLSSFDKLQKLQIWFEVGGDNPRDAKHLLTFAAAEMMFNRIRKRKDGSHSRLQQLKVHSSVPRCGPGYERPNPGALWDRNYLSSLVCELSNMEQDAGDYVICHPDRILEYHERARTARMDKSQKSRVESTSLPFRPWEVLRQWLAPRSKTVRLPYSRETNEAWVVAHDGSKLVSQWQSVR